MPEVEEPDTADQTNQELDILIQLASQYYDSDTSETQNNSIPMDFDSFEPATPEAPEIMEFFEPVTPDYNDYTMTVYIIGIFIVLTVYIIVFVSLFCGLNTVPCDVLLFYN